MNKHHHPRDRSERRKEASLDHSLKKKSSLRHKKETIKIEELENELREQVLGKTTS